MHPPSILCLAGLLMALLAAVAMGADEPIVVGAGRQFIYGKLNEKVNVYVKMYRDSPFLACMDEVLSREEIIDPLFLWIGPDGRNLKGQNYVNVTETGKLRMRSFQKSMSGSYSCTLSYKRIKSNPQEEKEAFKTYKFMLFAYRDPDYTFQVNVRFSTQECNTLENEQYFEELKKVIEDLIFSLTCQLTDAFLKCHVIKVPKGGLQNQLFITFKAINSTEEGELERWEGSGAGAVGCSQKLSYWTLGSVPMRSPSVPTIPICEDSIPAVPRDHLLQARERIEEFFMKQSFVKKKEYNLTPTIHYIEQSLEILRLDSCRPGFGKNEFTHADCPDCCVVCGHGTYNSNSDVHCRACSSIRINYYGATAC